MHDILKNQDYKEIWRWLDRQTSLTIQLDDFILSIEDSPEQLKAVLDFLKILMEIEVIKPHRN
jgi:hypothetical protein